MSYNIRLKRLLDFGFYPNELPPTFRTQNFSSVSKNFAPPLPYVGSTTYFDGATFRGNIRTFGVVNPCNYFLLSSHISNHWKEISQTFRMSQFSGSRLKFPRDLKTAGRAFSDASLSSRRKQQEHLASLFPIILQLDINRFYGSIYSHSIPWAVLGKEQAKAMRSKKKLRDHWSDELDKFLRNSNLTQTIGIPIGPDTSRIISEIILSRIDKELISKASNIQSQQIYHNIDDYQIGDFEMHSLELAQSHFGRVVSRYELRINDFKTNLKQGIEFSPDNFKQHFMC